jgi:hypothetical protein
VDKVITTVMNMIPECKDERFEAYRTEVNDGAIETGDTRPPRGRAQKLGAEIVQLLHKYEVPAKPIYDRINNGTVQQNGIGWHVASIKNYMGATQPPSTVMFALSDEGKMLEFSRKSLRVDLDPSRKNVEVRGIIFTTDFDDRRSHSLMTNPTYLRGVASLIKNHRFYSDKTVYDYR